MWLYLEIGSLERSLSLIKVIVARPNLIGLMLYTKRKRCTFFFLSTMSGHRARKSTLTRKQTLLATLPFRPLEWWENKCLLFKPLSLWYFVMAAPVKTSNFPFFFLYFITTCWAQIFKRSSSTMRHWVENGLFWIKCVYWPSTSSVLVPAACSKPQQPTPGEGELRVHLVLLCQIRLASISHKWS